jgi:hypothetical protein
MSSGSDVSEKPKAESGTEKPNETRKITRRQFIVGTVGGVVVGAAIGAAAGSLAFPTIPASKYEPWLPSKWDDTADVVVVGYGGSGAVTAITAFDAGAKVLILEKTPSYATLGVANPPISGGGGNTCMNAGFANNVTDPVAAANYIYAAGWGNTPMDVCQALANAETDTTDWLTKMGIKYTLFPGSAAPEFPALGGVNAFGTISLTSGFVFFQALDGLVQKRGIPIMFGTPATELIQNGDTGEILGVAATSGGSTIHIKANKAVVLATGSFEYNEALKSGNLRCYPLHGEGWQFCTGDGVSMASKVGAAMWHMGSMSLGLVAWFPEYPIAFSSPTPATNNWIYVDTLGNRWIDETQGGFSGHPWNFGLELSDFDLNVPGYTRIPTFIIFDATCAKAGPISSGPTAPLPTQLDPRPQWSSDNSVEIGKGWILQGATIADLATAINSQPYVGVPPGTNNTGPAASITVNIDPNALTDTVNAWNADCAAGVDSQFGRPASALAPIQTPPFYAMPIWPGGPSLYGGPVRNAAGQICDANNNPIPRLYGVGESGNLAGGFLDVMTNNGQIIGIGRLVGANAAAETSWS